MDAKSAPSLVQTFASAFILTLVNSHNDLISFSIDFSNDFSIDHSIDHSIDYSIDYSIDSELFDLISLRTYGLYRMRSYGRPSVCGITDAV